MLDSPSRVFFAKEHYFSLGLFYKRDPIFSDVIACGIGKIGSLLQKSPRKIVLFCKKDLAIPDSKNFLCVCNRR